MDVLAQDDQAKTVFDGLRDGQKRSLIHYMLRIKDVDKQIRQAFQILKHPFEIPGMRKR